MKKYRIHVEDGTRFYPQVRKWFLCFPYWEDFGNPVAKWFGTEEQAINFINQDIKQELNRHQYLYDVGYGCTAVKNDREVTPGSVWRHFKGTTATVIDVVKHSETGEDLVIYRCTGNKKAKTNHKDGKYARPLNMFLSTVDEKQYPNAKQKYRFEKVLK